MIWASCAPPQSVLVTRVALRLTQSPALNVPSVLELVTSGRRELCEEIATPTTAATTSAATTASTITRRRVSQPRPRLTGGGGTPYPSRTGGPVAGASGVGAPGSSGVHGTGAGAGGAGDGSASAGRCGGMSLPDGGGA
jgi:hypothetical protein